MLTCQLRLLLSYIQLQLESECRHCSIVQAALRNEGCMEIMKLEMIAVLPLESELIWIRLLQKKI